jgi:hypothetical protein
MNVEYFKYEAPHNLVSSIYLFTCLLDPFPPPPTRAGGGYAASGWPGGEPGGKVSPQYKRTRNVLHPHRWCLHLIMVVGFECSRDPDSYADGSVATARVTHAGQVKR